MHACLRDNVPQGTVANLHVRDANHKHHDKNILEGKMERMKARGETTMQVGR